MFFCLQTRKFAGIKSRYAGSPSVEISSEQHRRHSEPPIHQISSSNNTKLRPSSENISSKSKILSEKNLENAQGNLSRLRLGSIIVLSDIDMELKLTEYKPDITVSFHQLSQFEASTPLMSGGQVVSEKNAHLFRCPDIYADDPITYGVASNHMPINEQSSLGKSSTEIFVHQNIFSGGIVTDTSSKGLILPEVFSLKPDNLNDSYEEEDLSDGESPESFTYDSDVSMDFLSNTPAIREINSSNSDIDECGNGLSGIDVPSKCDGSCEGTCDEARNVIRQRNDIDPSR